MGDGENIIIVGAFREAVELCEDAGLQIAGIFDREKTGSFAGYPVLGDDTAAREKAAEWKHLPILLTPDQPALRAKLAEAYASWGYTLRGVTSPAATISRSATIAATAIVQAGANVSSDSSIGDHARLNVRCNVMHDCVVGSFATIAPNAVILGRVTIGERAYIGANATILPGLTIGAGAMVGAGAVVTRNVEAGHVVAGCPARVIKTQNG